jgi:hypothetical protein
VIVIRQALLSAIQAQPQVDSNPGYADHAALAWIFFRLAGDGSAPKALSGRAIARHLGSLVQMLETARYWWARQRDQFQL